MSNINTGLSNIPLADNPMVRRYKQRQLMRHTAWVNSQPTTVIPMPDEQEKREIYAGCDFKDYEPRKGFKCKEYF